MSPSSPWQRVIVGIVAAAVAIRVAIELIEPVLPFLIAAVAIAGVIVLVRWWRNRW